MRFNGALWIGPTPNQTPNGMVEVRGLVQHVQDGYESGSEEWFRNPKSQSSSHFLNPKTGQLRQMVDTRDKAWAEAAGNAHWISVENEGFGGDSLTDSQIQNLVDLYSWLHEVYGIPFVITDDPNGNGYGWHGMGGSAWGGHYDCPGQPMKDARSMILDLAAGHTPVQSGAPWPGRYLSVGSVGSDVAHMQQKLYERGWLHIGPIDGIFGEKTRRVIHQYQIEKGLLVDDIIGKQTWDSIENSPVT